MKNLGKNWLKLMMMSLLGLTTFFAISAVTFAGTTPAITNIDHKNGVNRVLVEFNAPVWGDTAYTTALTAAAFQLGGTCGTGVTTISSVTHTAGDDWAVLNVNGTVTSDMSTGSCTIAAKANSIFTVGGALSEKTLAWDATPDTTVPTISSATTLNGQAEVLVTFSEHVYGEADGTAALVNADFAYDDAAGGTDGDACTGTAAGTVLHEAGNNWAVWTCSVNLTTAADIDDNEEMDLASATVVYDLFGNAAAQAQNANLAADAGVSTFATGFVATKAEATVGATKILVKFSEPVFNNATPTMAADIVAGDLTYVDTTEGTRLISTITPTRDQKWAVLTLSTALVVADLTDATADTVNAAAGEVFDTFAQTQATTTMKLADNTDPVITSLAYNQATGANIFTITYSEKVTIPGLASASATMTADTSTVGDYSVAGALQGFGTFGTVGTITVPATKNTLAIDSTQKIITVTVAGATGGYMATSTTTTTVPSGVFTPEITGAGIADLRPSADTANDIEITSVQSTLTTTLAWDTTRPTVSSCVLSDSFYNNASLAVGLTFGAGSDGKADTLTCTSSETLKTIADAGATRDDWTSVAGNASEFGATLTTVKAAASGTTYTLNFSGANNYYSDAAFTVLNTQDTTPSFVDRAGNPVASGKTAETYKVCFTGFTCAAGTIGNVAVTTNGLVQPSANTTSTVAPAAPTKLTATVNAKMQVDLTWVDSASINSIVIYKTSNGGTESTLNTVSSGLQKYTDVNVKTGDVVKYRLVAYNIGGVASAYTDYVTLTVAAAAAATTTTTTTTTETITVTLGAQNTSGESGTATITEVAGKTVVVLALTGGAKDVAQPAHVHLGSCDKLGAAQYPLTDVLNGASTTTLSVSLADYKKMYPLAINVHKSTPEVTTYVSCGNVDVVAATTGGDTTVTTTTDKDKTTTDTTSTTTKETTTTVVAIKLSDIATHWAHKEVQGMVDKGIIKGYKDGTFKPDSSINRAESAILLCRVMGIDEKIAATVKPLKDVDIGAWFAGCVGELVAQKIVGGNAEGKFMATSNISRAEFLKLVMLAYANLAGDEEKASVEALIAGKPTTAFADLDGKAWYVGIITAAKEKGFLMGKSCGKDKKDKCVDANASITRAEAATILYRVFNDLI